MKNLYEVCRDKVEVQLPVAFTEENLTKMIAYLAEGKATDYQESMHIIDLLAAVRKSVKEALYKGNEDEIRMRTFIEACCDMKKGINAFNLATEFYNRTGHGIDWHVCSEWLDKTNGGLVDRTGFTDDGMCVYRLAGRLNK